MKVVFETSQGVKNNVTRTLTKYGRDYFEKLNGNSAKIFFVTSCIHALLQERRKYIPQGNINNACSKSCLMYKVVEIRGLKSL